MASEKFTQRVGDDFLHRIETFGGTKDYPVFSAHGETREGLDPCPFCGSTDVEVSNTHTPNYSGRCEDCGAEGPGGTPSKWDGRAIRTQTRARRLHAEAMANGVALWNTRRGAQ